nr:FAD-binding oxidoreductase [Rhizobium grahamii]
MNKAPITRKKALHRDQPLWLETPRISILTRKSASRTSFDVVIVGAGISGALMAHAFVGQGMSVLVIDRRQPVRGSSLASTAMIQHEIDVPLHVLTKTIGVKKAQRVWQRSAGAVQELVQLTNDLKLGCSFERKRTLFLAGEAYGSRALRAESEARKAAAIGVEYLGGRELYYRHQIDRPAALESDISASANPAQLTAGILRHAREHGTEVVAGVEIRDVRSIGDKVAVSTAGGDIIDAHHVVFCTGYEFLEALASKSQKVISTWALASRPHLERPEWINRYLVWEGADPYLYFRSTSDGRVIVGGEDEADEGAYLDEAKRARKTKLLVEKLNDITGISVGKPDFEWSAAFGTTPNGLPMIGRVPTMDNVFVTMGFGGNGITFSQIAADLISGEILGRRDADWDLFPIS